MLRAGGRFWPTEQHKKARVEAPNNSGHLPSSPRKGSRLQCLRFTGHLTNSDDKDATNPKTRVVLEACSLPAREATSFGCKYENP